MGGIGRLLLVAAAAALGLGGCAGAMPADRGKLLGVLEDRSAQDEARIEADRRWAAMTAEGKEVRADETRLAALEEMVWLPGESEGMRSYALDQIRAADARRAGRVLRQNLPRMEDWGVLEHACGMVVELGDKSCVEALVVSLARPAKRFGRRERPEAVAMEKVMGMELEVVLGRVMMGGDESQISDLKYLKSQNAESQDFKSQISDFKVQNSEFNARSSEFRAQSSEVKVRSSTRSMSVVARVAAMDVLGELRGEGCVKGLLWAARAAGGRDEFVGLMTWWVGLFGTLPVGMQEVEWVRELRKPGNAELVKLMAAGHERLKGEKDYVFAPRFVGLLGHHPLRETPSLIGWKADPTRAELVGEIRGKLAGLKHVKREASYAGAGDDVDESLEGNEGKLSRCDLLAIRELLGALERTEFRREVMRLGLEDRADGTSEHGGLMGWKLEDGSWKLELRIYPPGMVGNDVAYMSSDELLRETLLGLAEFHFHFQEARNERNAGPGMGDLKYVREMRCNGVVFTSVKGPNGGDGFDVDYYTPGGSVVDLGVWE